MRSILKTPLIVLLAALASSLAQASSLAPSFTARDLMVMDSEPYIAAHSDYRWYRAGAEAMQERRFGDAREHFLLAARFADKRSQAMLGEMYWRGQGTPVDRATAYAWMDLAAERLYARYVGHRERYWEQMNERERTAAKLIGEGLYAEFGDAVAKPRIEAELRQELSRMTGSRAGASTLTRTYAGIPPSLGLKSVAGPEINGFNDPKYWHPEKYWEWQDQAYRALRKHRVLVREVVITLGGKRGSAPAVD